MSKVNFKKNNNLISSITSGQQTLDNPEYNEAVRELYGKIIYTLNGLNNAYCPSFSKEEFINMIKNLSDENMRLADNYYNKYVKAMRESDEIYIQYEKTIKDNEDKYNSDLLMLDEKLNIKIAEIDRELEKLQQD